MAARVSLRRVVEELDALTDETSAYLNRETGELYSLGDEEAGLVEDGIDPAELPEWLIDEVPRIREVLGSTDWLALPTRFDIHEWAIMDGFARSIDDADVRDELLTAIRDKGAFRWFKDAVHRHGIHQDWYDHRAAALGRIAMDWLDEHGVDYAPDADTLPEDPASNPGIQRTAEALE
ncbi:MAG: UPF0158 family protein [Coriobacteriia bacterium]|nr:UPF0158 family protein [Coriobacteriia bacterium]